LNYKCNFCNAVLLSSYSSSHVAKHFQSKEFTDKWLRKHFEEFFRKSQPSLEEHVDLLDMGFSL
jgi:hypothetical protein